MAAKKKAPEAPPPTQRERALEAIGRMHSFDSFWLEKLTELFKEPEDGSLTGLERLDATRLWRLAGDLNEMRKKFPKPWVTT